MSLRLVCSLPSTFGRTTGPLRFARPGARSDYLSRCSTSCQRPFWGAALMHSVVKGHPNGDWNREVVQRTEGYGFIQPDDGGRDVFVHISAVERSGMRGLAEGQKVAYELETDRRTGKESAANLKSA